MEGKWQKVIILTVTIAIFLVLSTQGKILGACDEDWECGAGFYCSSNLCENCIPCEKIFNRQSPPNPSGEPSCAKSVAKCGQCLQGFQDHGLKDQKCYPSKETSTPSSRSSTTVAVPSAWPLFLDVLARYLLYRFDIKLDIY